MSPQLRTKCGSRAAMWSITRASMSTRSGMSAFWCVSVSTANRAGASAGGSDAACLGRVLGPRRPEAPPPATASPDVARNSRRLGTIAPHGGHCHCARADGATAGDPSWATCPRFSIVECVEPVAAGQPDRPLLSKRAPPGRDYLARPAGPWASAQAQQRTYPRTYGGGADAPPVSAAVGQEKSPTNPGARSGDAAVADSRHRVVGSEPALPCERVPQRRVQARLDLTELTVELMCARVRFGRGAEMGHRPGRVGDRGVRTRGGHGQHGSAHGGDLLLC